MKLNPYLSFHGNCRVAMDFYQQILGGELTLQTIGESPLSEQMPPKMRELILHSALVAGSVTIMGSDMVGPDGLHHGNANALMLDCDNEADVHRIFAALSDGGTVNHPLRLEFFGAYMGNVTDRFGHTWMLHHRPA